jgi:hypothetical protein
MGIAIVIVGGLALLTFIPVFFDYLAKRRPAVDADAAGRLERLEAKIAALEAAAEEQRALVARQGDELAFVNRLLDDRAPAKAAKPAVADR